MPAYGLLLAIFNVLAGCHGAIAATSPAHLMVLGDSLSAGYELAESDSFPAQLGKALDAAGYKIQVDNAGVSGDTAADGKARLDWVLGDAPPAYAILELGANDMLRGIDPAVTETNLDAIIAAMKGKGVKLLIAGMMGARNLGKDYDDQFDAIYPRLAAKYKAPLYPFFLDGIALDPALTLADRMHPNPQGVAIMVRNILPAVEKLLGPPPSGTGS